jgi:hypothetical protein
MSEVSDSELKKVIGDFLEMGHVENIVSMFKKEPLYFEWTGEILEDERFNVRLGLTILFEELQALGVNEISCAIPSLQALLDHQSSLIRGEAIGILGIIATDEAIQLIRSKQNDPNPQVREMVAIVLEDHIKRQRQ